MKESDQPKRTEPSIAPKLVPIESSWNVFRHEPGNTPKSTATKNVLESPLPNFHLKSRLILRVDAIRDALELGHLPNEIHVKLASCIRRVGGALLATVDDLASVPLREIPIRIAPIDARSMPNVDSILTADAIELQLGDWSRSDSQPAANIGLRPLCIEWPLDVPDMLRLAKKVELIRALSNHRVPVGVAIPVGDASEVGLARYRWIAEIDIDFVTIRTAAACLSSRHPAQAYFRCDPIELTRLAKKLIDEAGKKPVAMVIDHPWSDGYQAGQAILSGASFVGVGSCLAKLIPSPMESAGMRSMDSLASGLLGQSSIKSTTLSTASVAYFMQKLDLNSALTLFADQMRASLEYS